MPKTQFEARIYYGNALLFPLTLFPRFKIPRNVSLVTAPTFTDSGTLYKMAQPTDSMVVGGYTDSHFSLRFADFTNQWKKVQPERSDPAWQFQGGVVSLELTITVYVNQVFRDHDKILAIIMEHELLHVSDEIKIATHSLPAHVPKSEYVKKFLVDGHEVDNRMFKEWIEGQGLEEYVRKDVYLPEHNRLVMARDFGREYDRYRERINNALAPNPVGRRRQ